MKKLVVGRVASEFEIQALIYTFLLSLQLKVRGEVRCTVGGVKARFDIVVFDERGNVSYVVEVKPGRGKRWRDHWLESAQHKLYSECPVPVLMVCGDSQARDFMKIAATISIAGLKPGVIWHEEWHAASSSCIPVR